MKKHTNRLPAVRTTISRDRPPGRGARHHGGVLERTPPDAESVGLNTAYLGDPDSTIIHRVAASGFEDLRVSAGDLVIADRRVPASSGSLVIAMIEGEMAVRRFSGRYLFAGDGSRQTLNGAGGSRVEVLATVVSVIPVAAGLRRT